MCDQKSLKKYEKAVLENKKASTELNYYLNLKTQQLQEVVEEAEPSSVQVE